VSTDIRDKVLRYVLFALRGNEIVKSDLCDEVQIAADEARAEVVRLKAELVRSNTEIGRVKDLVEEFCNDPIWDRL
jgi:hypothetical protein